MPPLPFTLTALANESPDSKAVAIYRRAAGTRTIELLGERGLLAVPVGDLIRLRHNPFYPYVEKRVGEFLGPPPRRAAEGERRGP